ncbi:MAG TPA: hypothetical protein VFH77_18220 [Streptomyces sp.]|nr:hypothetical protein [Streptomyces sp.]
MSPFVRSAPTTPRCPRPWPADGTVEIVRATMRAGHKTVVAALAPDGTALAAGQYHPAEGTTEIGGVGTLSTARRQGLGAAGSTLLIADQPARM